VANLQKARAAQAQVRRDKAGMTASCAASLEVFIALITGMGWTHQETLLNFMGIPTPAESSFYYAQNLIADELTRLCHESCARFRALMSPGTVLGYDAACSHPRWSSQAFGWFR
jgi:hypothetical protein